MRYFIIATLMTVFTLMGVINTNALAKKKQLKTGIQALDLQEMTAADYSATRLICPEVGSFTAPCDCCTVSVASDQQKVFLLRQRTSADLIGNLVTRYPSNRNT